MVKSKYYYLYSKNLEEVSFADAIGNDKLDYELIPELELVNKMPFEFNLIKQSHSKKGLVKDNDLSSLKKVWYDYQYNSLAWPLFSERIKLIIDNHLTGNEALSWIKAKVNGNGEQKIYYVPKFTEKLDVLDLQETTFVPSTDHIIVPKFSNSKIQEYAVFSTPSTFWQIPLSMIVDETIKEEIEKQKMEEVFFEEISITFS